MTTLSPGKWRGLATTSTPNHTFAILAFDQRGSYVKMLPDDASYDDAVDIKNEVVEALSPYATAVLLDPIYGLKSAQNMAGSSGLLMAVEKTGYSGEATARRIDFMDYWDVGKIKRVGASAVKLLAYYHPDSGEVAEEIEETIRQVAVDCKTHDLPLFVEPICYSLDPAVPRKSAAFAEQLPTIVRETVRRFSPLGMDVLKVEFPVDAAFDSDKNHWRAACEAISEISVLPWALLSAGVDFETFEQQVQVACEAGASGILGGRAIWKECIAMDAAGRQTFLQDVAAKRLAKLRQIVEENGKSWTDYFEPTPSSEDWFEHYA
ncbi:MAG: tagatose 1,6-diphosphate aldolase [Anaerolineae bacterium]|nr:tagatose 1,6-diphosphate aldolase [Anaerolineae bacterium]